MLKVTVENEIADQPGASFELEQQQESWTIDNTLFDGDVVRLSENHYHVIWANKSYNVEVIQSNHQEKTFQLLINGLLVKTSVKDQFDLLLEGMGLEAKAVQKINHVKAPMPGLIQSIAVSEGDHVNKGDTLLVLVAMKMENIIKASGDGIVKSLKINSGDTVEKNQVMLEFH
ncbi:biotin/lipoyl-containing protein [Dyadobacter psychrotolerans]|uniref:Biotin/lipoyl-binding protein n=1 Tax=Dyadobacter psychrotolerans TaxID=2541721 RepID=A0A4R5DQP7_9BACT|nr:biotin/lipoyl-containing protein [Dyadobacter psychrotolerans]TDE13335.1 biotin/lipoyl-binding protein [Dyadobacter psychrotolerans]